MEYWKNIHDVVRKQYQTSEPSFMSIRVNSLSEIAMTVCVMLECADEVSVFCDERNFFHKEYYEQIRRDESPQTGDRTEKMMSDALFGFSHRENARLNLIVKSFTRSFFEGLIVSRDDFLRVAFNTASFSHTNPYKPWVDNLPPFAFTGDLRLWIRLRHPDRPSAVGMVASDLDFIDTPTWEEQTFADLWSKSSPLRLHELRIISPKEKFDIPEWKGKYPYKYCCF